MDSNSHEGAVSPDTQAVLLLCGIFSRTDAAAVKPLTLGEYNALAAWLSKQGRRPADLLQAGDALFPAEEPGLPPIERVRALLGRGFQMATTLEHWQRLGLWVMSRGEKHYPERLRRNLRHAAPALLYGAGDMTRLEQGGLAIVGSRAIDEEGIAFTRLVAERCAAAGMQVISGGARGVDQAAVAAALDASGGAVAVLPDRLDRTATSGEAKELLRRGQLTLVTPFEPEFGFSIGKTMARNKCIYALADQSLVVRFVTGEGGTWAGALEQLGRNQRGPARVPVFVRVAGNPADGWLDLQSKGALPFPEKEFLEGDITSALKSNVAPPSPPQERKIASSAEPVSPPPVAPESCYQRCLPLLLAELKQEPRETQLPEIAKRLELLPKQLGEWLKRAIEEGKIKKVKKKRVVVYVIAALVEEPSLFGQGDDAA